MTNEQAIKWIKQIQKVGYQDNLLNHKESLDMAIEALEQEPKLRQALEQEKGAYNALVKDLQCSDYISRQAVLEIIRKCHCEEWVKADIGAPIEALSPVTPAEKVGHWIEDEYEMKVWCSKCGEEHEECSKYCPNCGAKMEVEE